MSEQQTQTIEISERFIKPRTPGPGMSHDQPWVRFIDTDGQTKELWLPEFNRYCRDAHLSTVEAQERLSRQQTFTKPETPTEAKEKATAKEDEKND